MEISVGFADTDKDYNQAEFIEDSSILGKVYIPREGVDITGDVRIRYEKHPWVECFEVDGVKPRKAIRTGYGTRSFRAFVQSLNTIYAKAYNDYTTFPDAAGYFEHVTERFVQEYCDEVHKATFKRFCGFVENLWREGTKEIHDIAMEIVLPIIKNDEEAGKIFEETITDEFRKYIGEYNG